MDYGRKEERTKRKEWVGDRWGEGAREEGVRIEEGRKKTRREYN